MQSWLGAAKEKASSLADGASDLARSVADKVDELGTGEAAGGGAERVVARFAAGAPLGLALTAEAPEEVGAPVLLSAIEPGSAAALAHPELGAGWRLDEINGVPIAELPFSAVSQMLEHKQQTRQDFALTFLAPPKPGWLPAELVRVSSSALDSARTSASAVIDSARGWSPRS